MVTRIYIEPAGKKADGTTKQGYHVRQDAPDGALLVADSRTPFYDGARALRALGLTGEFQMWGPMGDGTFACRMGGTIEVAAKRYLHDSPTGMRFVSEEKHLRDVAALRASNGHLPVEARAEERDPGVVGWGGCG